MDAWPKWDTAPCVQSIVIFCIHYSDIHAHYTFVDLHLFSIILFFMGLKHQTSL